MNDALFLCDGAHTPEGWHGRWSKTEHLNTEGERATVNFAIKDVEETFLGSLDGRALDLIRIAAFALAADQSVSRGGIRDPQLRAWHRRLGLVVPVNDPDFWSQSAILSALCACLGFVSDDEWHFGFVPPTIPELKQFTLSDQAPVRNAEVEVVIPFSGGIDSLTAVVEQLDDGRQPLLISHASSHVPEGRRIELLDGLRGLFPGRRFGRVGAKVNRVHGEAKEATNRSRSFFYASLATVAAIQRGAGDVLLADNGWASVNPRINDQLVGGLATRSTHPRFFRLFNELVQLVFEDAPLVRNPFWDLTRADVLERLRDAGGAPLLSLTRSCAAGRNLRRETPHCGRCSQCIDRRFATEATGLTEYDPPEAYTFDIFGEPLTGTVRSLGLSYVRAARKIETLSNWGIFEEFPELLECISEGGSEDEAQIYVNMFHRQANFVLRVIEEELGAAVPRIARGDVEAESLIGLLAQEQSREGATAGGLLHSADYSSVVWQGQTLSHTRTQALVVRNLFLAHKQGLEVLSSTEALNGSGREGSKMSNVFKGSASWNTFIRRVGRRGYYLDIPQEDPD